VRIIQATEASTNITNKYTNILHGANNYERTTDKPTNQLLGEIKRPFTVIAKISENYTENYIENKYYNNGFEERWSITLTFSILLTMTFIVLACSAICLKKIQK